MWAVIGGSGFERFEGFETIETLSRETPFGQASAGFKKVRVAGQEILFVSRHGDHHELLPSEINYRANIFALKKYGAKAILSFSAVGSLQAQYPPEHLVIPTQYIDRTKGVRAHSFCGEGLVGHMSLAYPVCQDAARRVGAMAEMLKIPVSVGGTYVCIEGPNFSTLSESLSYRQMNADIIGMTNFPEYSLAREAGLSYIPCCFVTDYDCWDTSQPHVTLEQVIAIMKRNNGKAFELLKRVVSSSEKVLEGCNCANEGLRVGLMTPPERRTPEQNRWLETLTK